VTAASIGEAASTEELEVGIRTSLEETTSGPGDDAFQPYWLEVALEALLRGRTAQPPAELGIETAGTFMTLRIDEGGTRVTLRPERRPDTILVADPQIVLGLAAGAISVDQAQSRATVHGDPRALAAVLAGAEVTVAPGPSSPAG
jgi:hypothetical protein